jgi:hypothetical protein
MAALVSPTDLRTRAPNVKQKFSSIHFIASASSALLLGFFSYRGHLVMFADRFAQAVSSHSTSRRIMLASVVVDVCKQRTDDATHERLAR